MARDTNRAKATAALLKFRGDSGSGGTTGLVPAPSAGQASYYLKGDGTWASVAPGSGIANVVEDLTPQLGGDLDLNGHVITGLVIGTNVQAYDADLTTWAGITPSANAQSLVSALDYAAMRTLLSLVPGTDFYSKAAADAAFQPLDADLTTWASVTPSLNGKSLVAAADYAAMRTLLSLVPGTDFYSKAGADAAFQPLDSDLTSLAAVATTAAGRSVLTAVDHNLDQLIWWDDSAGTAKTLVLADVTTEAAPATGDFILVQRAEDDIAKVDWSSLPGAASGLPAATQAEMEAASSLTVAASPGRQQFHPSAAKCWGRVTVSAGTPTLQANYNITSITDTNTGRLTVTIATDFSSADYCVQVSIARGASGSANAAPFINSTTGLAVGSFEVMNEASGGGDSDPAEWYFVAFGDQ